MNDAQRDQLLAARDEWRAAERAYSEEAARYVGVWWMADGPPPEDRRPEPVTSEALATMRDLRLAADAARAAYYDLAASIG